MPQLRSYYDVLGVNEKASDEEIRHAYRQLAREWHPDKNPSPDAVAKTQELNEAYTVLKDPVKRSMYDAGEGELGDVDMNEAPSMIPESIIRFSLQAGAVPAILQKWIESLWLAPNGISRNVTFGSIRQLYIPYWRVSISLECLCSGHIGKPLNDESASSSKSSKLEYSHDKVTLTYLKKYKNILFCGWDGEDGDLLELASDLGDDPAEVDGVRKCWNLDENLISPIPSDTTNICEPSAASFARFQIAYKRYRSFKLVLRLLEDSKAAFMKHYEAKKVKDYDTTSARIVGEEVQLCLLPVYATSYTYKDHEYQVVINGETGRCHGKRPYSHLKVGGAVVGSIAMVGASLVAAPFRALANHNK